PGPPAPYAPGDPDDARVAGQVVDHARFSAERVLQKMGDLFRERRVDLEQRRALRREHAGEVRCRAPDELQAVLPRGHREARLEGERRAFPDEMFERVVTEIRKVGDDEV